MQTARIAITAARGAGKGFTAQMSVAAEASGPFAAVKGATASIAADVVPHCPVADPSQPGQNLTVARVLELQAKRRHLDRVGAFMRALLARGKLLEEWDGLRQAGPVRTVLEIGADAALAPLQALPWERLADGAGGFPALDPGSAFTRAQGALASAPALADWPVRVLIAFCAAPEAEGEPGAQQIGAEAERMALERLFASPQLRFDVEYDVLEHPSVDRIIEGCERVQPHVLHFIGHGRGDGPPAQHALSLWRPDEQRYEDWPLGNIALQLKDTPAAKDKPGTRRAPRLAFLNACRTGAGWTEPAPVASLDQAFLRAGSVAALAMQGDIAGDMALVFSTQFYRELIGGADVDAAVQAARLKMTLARPGAIDQEANWSLPRLTLRVLPDQVLPRPPAQPVQALADRFVARLPERREAHEAIRCCASAADKLSHHLLFIVGSERSGKSHLARWTAQACKRAGNLVAEVSFAPQDKVDWLDALRWIRDGQRRQAGVPPSPSPRAPLPARLFRDFNWALNRRQEGIAAFQPAPAVGEIADAGLALTASKEQPEDFARDTLASFRDALEACAEPNGLVLLLDQLKGLESRVLTETLMDNLLKPVAAGASPKVRMILVLDQSQHDELRGAFVGVHRAPRVVNVSLFSSADFQRLSRQLCHLWSLKLYDDQTLIKTLQGMDYGKPTSGPWGVQAFENLDMLFGLWLKTHENLAGP